ncbi:MAG: hypothetical protein RL189_1601 [Pseudomonadota bacterium]
MRIVVLLSFAGLAVFSSSCKQRNFGDSSSAVAGADQATSVQRDWFGFGKDVKYKCAGSNTEHQVPASTWQEARKTICPGEQFELSLNFRHEAGDRKCGTLNNQQIRGHAERALINQTEAFREGEFRGFCQSSYFSKCEILNIQFILEDANIDSHSCHYNVKLRVTRKDTTDGKPVKR